MKTYSNAISARLAQKPKYPKARKVHSRKQSKAALGIAQDQPLPRDQSEAQDDYDATVGGRFKKGLGSDLFKQAHKAQHDSHKRYKKDYVQKMKDKEAIAKDLDKERLQDKGVGGARSDAIEKAKKRDAYTKDWMSKQPKSMQEAYKKHLQELGIDD